MKTDKIILDSNSISLIKKLYLSFCNNLFFTFFLLLFTSFSAKTQISSNSLHFDGSNFLIVGESPLLDIQSGSATTYEGWIRFCSDGMIFSKNWCNGDAGYFFNIVNGGKIKILGVANTVCNAGYLFELTTTQTYALNTWHHFAVVIVANSSSTNVKVYMNGLLVLSTIQNGFVNNSSQNFIIGAYKYIAESYGSSYTGDLDEFRIYNTALLPSEMGLAIPTNPLLIIHYPMEPQMNPLATSEPNLGTLGAAFNADDVVLTSQSTPDVLNYNATSDYLPNVDLGADTFLNCGVTSLNLFTNNTATTYSWQQSNPSGSTWLPIVGANLNSLNYSLGSNNNASIVVIGTLGLCTDSDTINISTGGTNTNFLGNDTIICTGQNITFDASIVSSTYLWQDGSVASSYTTSSPGLYWVEVTNNGCVSVDSVNVTVLQIPIADFTSSVSIGTTPLNVIFTNSSQNASTYIWNYGEGLPYNTNSISDVSYTYSNPGTFVVYLNAFNGACSDQDTLTIIILPTTPPTLDIPNVFTPNEDQVNDEFIIQVTSMQELDFVILNRWGIVIYEYNSIVGYWDGKVKGKDASEGVYFYKYKAYGLNGDMLEGHGNFTLLR